MKNFAMRRRTVLAGIASLAAPAIARAEGSRVLKFVPRTAFAILDPVWTTDAATRAFALSIFESLYSVDEKLVPYPQMAAGQVVEDDGRRWTIRLREDLWFHDGEPVLARDCVASITRWMKRDAVGKTLALRLDALGAPDDRTIVFRLNKPFPQPDHPAGTAAGGGWAWVRFNEAPAPASLEASSSWPLSPLCLVQQPGEGRLCGGLTC